jgi:hypothetical protein
MGKKIVALTGKTPVLPMFVFASSLIIHNLGFPQRHITAGSL